jgi:hypothetical protein
MYISTLMVPKDTRKAPAVTIFDKNISKPSNNYQAVESE